MRPDKSLVEWTWGYYFVGCLVNSDHCDATGICTGENPALFLIQRRLDKKKKEQKKRTLSSSLCFPPSFSYVFSLVVATGRPHRISWLDRQSILICSGDTAPFDISPKNWLLWWFFFSLRAFSYSVQFSVWKTLRRVSHCLSNIFNPIYCGHMSHSIACLSLVTWMHAHTNCTHAHSNAKIYRLKYTSAHKHAPNQRNRCHFVTFFGTHESVKMKAWREMSEWNMRLQQPLFSTEEDVEE